MGLSGKVLGAGLGFLVGGPVGAVIGGILGHYAKDAALPDGEPDADPSVRQQREEFYFVANLVGIVTAMLRADGDVRPEEIRSLRRFFSERLGYRGESLEIVREMVKEFLRTGVDIEALCGDFARRSDYTTRLLLMDCLWDVAGADGRIHPAEQAVFDKVARLLGVSADYRGDLRASGRTGGGHGDYELLGLVPSATPDQIKGAYRELVKKYHPDRVAHLGEEFQRLAHVKFLQVQEAYERLRTAHGL